MTDGIAVLYVEDDFRDRDLLSRQLKKQAPHFNVSLVSSVSEAKDLLTEKPFDVVLIDYMLPDESGISLVRWIQDKDLSCASVMITGQGDTNVALTALKAGVANYIVKKPGYLGNLTSTIQSAYSWFKENKEVRKELINILYCADNLSEYQSLKELMSERYPNSRIELMTGAKSCLRSLNTASFDVCIVDAMMRDMNILDFIKEVFLAPLNIPIILVGNAGNEELVVQLLKLGASDYIVREGDYLFLLAHSLEITISKSRLREREETLKKERERAQTYLDLAGVIFVALNTKGEVTLINKKGCQVLAYEEEEVVGKNWHDSFLPERLKDEVRDVTDLLLTGKEDLAEYYENPVVTKLGEERLIAWHNTTLRNEKGEIIGHLSSGEDITERKRSEEEVRRRLIYEKMLNSISRLTFTISDINEFLDKSLKMMGETLDVSRVYIFEHRNDTDTMDNTFEWCAPEIIPQKDQLQGLSSGAAPWWMSMVRAGEVINYRDIEDIPGEQEKEILRSQGIKSILVVPIFVQNKYFGFMGFDECRFHHEWLVEDIEILKTITQIIASTLERKQTEEALRRSEQEFRLMAENVPGLFFYVDANGYYRFANKHFEEMFDLPTDEIVGEHYRQILGDATYEVIKDRVNKALSGQRVTYEDALPFKHGGKRWVSARYVPDIDDGGKVNGFFALVMDITDQKRAQHELLEKEGELKRQAQSLQELNAALKVLLQYREEERERLEGYILENVKELISPYIEKLENGRLDTRNSEVLGILKSNLKNLISPFAKSLSAKYPDLTHTEAQIADLIRHGKTSKEIASLMDVSLKTVEFHRVNIRKKFGLLHKKANLKSYLASFDL